MGASVPYSPLMLFLSEFLGAEVVDKDQRRVGRVKDITIRAADPYPVVTGLVLSARKAEVIPWSSVRTVVGSEVALRDTTVLAAAPDEMWLARDVLDKQVIDMDGRRVVRVNDLQLAENGGQMLLVAADIGIRGLLRRLGLEGVGKGIFRISGRDLAMVLVSWGEVHPVHEAGGDAVRLRISEKGIGKLHPADIADIVEELSAKQRSAIFESLTDEVAADTLEEMEPDDQVSVIEHMNSERASEILEEMHPDEVADLLADLPEERAQEILQLMEAEEAEDVRELLSFPEESAGGLMTTQYVAVRVDLSAAQCIDALRAMEPGSESVYYVYVIDDEEHLHGVLSLRDLIVARPRTPISEFMRKEVITTRLDANREEVAAVMSKYNLMALPVLDDEQKLRGIITVDDALETMLSEGVKRRLPRLYA